LGKDGWVRRKSKMSVVGSSSGNNLEDQEEDMEGEDYRYAIHQFARIFLNSDS
jgi:hypothetical protein